MTSTAPPLVSSWRTATSPTRLLPHSATKQYSGNHKHTFQTNADPGLAGFQFRRRRDRVNWRILSSVDVNKVQRDVDTSTLQQVIDTVAFSDIESDDLRDVDPNFVKLFQLSQLIIEYLLHCQNIMEQSESELTRHIEEQAHELLALQDQHDRDLTEIYALKKEVKALKKTIFAYQVMIKVPGYQQQSAAANGGNNGMKESLGPGTVQYHRCRYCPKVFNGALYLDSHLRRRHSDLPNYLAEECTTQTDPEPPEPDPAIAQQQAVIDQLNAALSNLASKMQESEATLRSDMESRLAKALTDREAELARIREEEHAEYEAELDALRRQMHNELETEREQLARERVELEALRAEVANATENLHRDRSGSVLGGNERSSGLGQLEDVDDEGDTGLEQHDEEVDVSEIKPVPTPSAPTQDMSALLVTLEQKQESALAALRDMVVKEIAAVRDQVSHTEDTSKQATSELGTSLAQRLEGLQSMLMQNQLGGKSKARSVSLPKLEIPPPSKAPEPEPGLDGPDDSLGQDDDSHIKMPAKTRSDDMAQQQAAKRNGPRLSIITAPPGDEEDDNHLGIGSDWPIISRHLRTHKHISLPYAPWIKSAMSHPPIQVIQMREQIAADLRRALTQRGVTTEALNDPEVFERLVNAFEQEKEDMHARDACFGPMYEIVWDDMEALTAKQFRFKPKPVMSPSKTTRFTPAIRGTTLAPGSNWRKIVSPTSPTRGVLKSVLRSSIAKSPSTPTRRVDWNSPRSPESDDDSDSDDSDKGVAQKAKSAIRSMTSRSPGNNASSWGGVRGAASAISNLRSPFASLPNRQSASAGPSAIGGGKSAFPMKSSPLRRGFSSADSPIPEESESDATESPSTAFRSSDYVPLTPKSRERHQSAASSRPVAFGAKRQTTLGIGNGNENDGMSSPLPSPVGARSVGFASVVSAAQSASSKGNLRKNSKKSRGEAGTKHAAQGRRHEDDDTDDDASHSESSPPQPQLSKSDSSAAVGLGSSRGSTTGSGSRLIHDKPGLNHVEVSSDESSYIAAPSRQPAPEPKKVTVAQPTEPQTADSSGIGQLLDELVSDDEAMKEQQDTGTRPPPIATRVIETKPAHNFSEWDVESV